MGIKWAIKLFPLLFLFLPSLVLANDTLGMVKGGNLVPKKTKEISMISEDLLISRDKIHVEYEFRNNSDKSVESIVLFPLMEFDAVTPYRIDDREFDKNKDPLDFSVKVDGVTIPIQIENKKSYIDKENDIYRRKVQYYWSYKFPPQKSVQVVHSYSPITGSGGLDEGDDERDYCMDDAFTKAFEKLTARLAKKLKAKTTPIALNEYMHYHSFARIDYVVKTAKNWAGPIQNFRLVIEKPSPGALVSTCWKGLKKINKTQFEFKQKNFIPDQDIRVIFIDDKFIDDK